jgi:hypothetical protein
MAGPLFLIGVAGATWVIVTDVPVEVLVSVGALGVFGERSKFVRASEPDALADPKLPALSVALALAEIVLAPLTSCVTVVVPLAITGLLFDLKS